ncbi:diaminobutyrate acetyltransferase [Maritimibacter sp. 55A14]|uniref:diaminobutyrate acetyltransferase n=1 Tax=Maritimibacter sp. 55A14 TaxID=2174844 RepID=UPI000D61BA92|nr:diaminobutyrate acetyltransferase [Maritimibacter sp. 55A14]PWE32681.1 diaminobutyrate acetyltransferase [Maritimibacter sp. 55A14]
MPVDTDGAAIWDLIRACKPLDENSMYCNLIQCSDFAETCVIAELDGEIVGWISAYIKPSEPDTVFVWQVAVSEAARGMGVGSRMLTELFERDVCAGVTTLQTTITRSNEASWALFSRFCDRVDGDMEHEPHFTREEHFDGKAATEHMVTIDLVAEGMKKAA